MTKQTYVVDWRTVGRDWPLLAVLIGDLAFALWAYPRLPERVPVHWGVTGEPDRWGAPAELAFGLWAVAVGAYLLVLYAPIIDPKRRNYASFAGTLRLLRWAVPLVVVLAHAAALGQAIGWHVNVSRIVFLSVAALLLVTGNYLGRVRPNYFVGIRLPWTLANEIVWQKTHRLGGWLFFVAGFVLLPAAWLPGAWPVIVLLAALALIVVLTTVYAYLTFQRVAKE